MSQKLQIYSVQDQRANIFHAPFFVRTHGEAERTFQQVVNDDKTQVGQYPEDFNLYHIGEYDDGTGKISPLDTPKHIIKAIALKQSRPSLVQQ